MTYLHKSGITGRIAWETEWEIGVACGGFTWTGSRESFEQQWSESP